MVKKDEAFYVPILRTLANMLNKTVYEDVCGVCVCVCVCACVCVHVRVYLRELYNHMWVMSFRSQMAIHQKIMCYVITAMVKCTRNMLSFLQRRIHSRSISISMKLNSVMHWGPRQRFINLVSESKNKCYCR